MLTGVILIYTWIPFLFHLQCKDDEALRVGIGTFLISANTEEQKRPNEGFRMSFPSEILHGTSARINQAFAL